MAQMSTYAWINDDGLDVANCVTVVVGAGVDEALQRFGADSSRVLDAVTDEAIIDGESIAVSAVPGGVVAVEPNGFQGSLEDVLLRVAGGGVAASVFWNVNGDNAFVLVRSGAVVVNVDMYDAEDGEDAESLSELGLPVELHDVWLQAAGVEGDPWAMGLAMAEAATGVAIPREAVAEPSAFHALPQR